MTLAARLVLAVGILVAGLLLALDTSIPAIATIAVVGLVAAVFISRFVSRPMHEIADAARSVAAGTTPRLPRSQLPEIALVIDAVRDMHEHVVERFAELERDQAQSAAIVEAMIEGIVSTDARGRVVTVNAAARRLLGYGETAVLPDLPTLFRGKAARDAVSQVLAGTAVVDRELELDGRVLTLNARPLPGGGAALVLHDLTEIRHLEAVRRDFVANVSHELKTPLTSISGYAETLTDRDMDPDTQQRFVATILTNARRMQRLVDDLLDLSRIESGRWTPQPAHTRVAILAAEVWNAFAARAQARGVALSVEAAADAELLYADPDAAGQILTNLIDNSLRHVGENGRIVVRSERHLAGVTLSVADNGVGIASEHLPRIFERFYRADPSRSRDQGGTGLGLAIIKHMVEAHGGDVSIESEPRKGTAVKCWFPEPSDRPVTQP